LNRGERRLGAPLPKRATPNKRLKLTGHRAFQFSVLPSGHENKRFQPPGHRGRQLSREPLGGASVHPVAGVVSKRNQAGPSSSASQGTLAEIQCVISFS
jgi:hypothetical protein